jgi:5-methylcytosine-specific restriction enzyme subunit McrC
VQLNANNRFYRFLIHLCELVFDCSLVHEQSGEYKFRDFLRADKPMARLYEKFVFNFFKREQTAFKVSSDRIYWKAESASDASLAYLPSMLTDISLRSELRTIIVDAKYYGNTLQTYFGRETIHSGNLYQIYAYLKNLEVQGGNDAHAEGVLLYPVTADTHNHRYDIDGHSVRVVTLNLASSWQDIERQLFELVA